MTAKKLYFILIGAMGLAVLALFGGVYAASMVLEQQAGKLQTARADNAALEDKEGQLIKARADITKYRPLAEIAKSIVPQDKDQAQAVREIVTLAGRHNVKLGSITFPTSTLGGGGGSKTSNAALSQLVPVKNIPGVYSLDISIASDTTAPAKYGDFLNFLDALEHNRRTALVNGITIQPTTADPGSLTFTLNISEYVKP